MSMTPAKLVKTAVCVFLLAFGATAFAANGYYEESIPGAAISSIDVNTDSSQVVVKGADVDDIKVMATLKVDKRYSRTDPMAAGRLIKAFKQSPPVEVEDGQLKISDFGRRSFQRHVHVNYEIVVPRDASVNVASVSGNVEVIGVDGPVKATSDEGEVKLADAAQ